MPIHRISDMLKSKTIQMFQQQKIIEAIESNTIFFRPMLFSCSVMIIQFVIQADLDN